MRKHGTGMVLAWGWRGLPSYPLTLPCLPCLPAACRLPKRERTSPCVTPFSDLAMCGNRIPGAFSVLRHIRPYIYVVVAALVVGYVGSVVPPYASRFFAYLKGNRITVYPPLARETHRLRTHNLGTCSHPMVVGPLWIIKKVLFKLSSSSSSSRCLSRLKVPACPSAEVPNRSSVC